ncbi:DNA topoisomerase 2-associated protein pat1 [Knufia obscura]|uniref:DNA topoisomerase 2-associated protein pat1 n=2 Tax=Knufia TaxID=430999 RepID=A0AAN8EJ42_9EURO|nr:DNA topoisomerase 2-associated protein pat1 [Knufia obscura]KAK5952032.1 DNA topoisomerase 2-associated protein pat1 [Knufia fluminis]
MSFFGFDSALPGDKRGANSNKGIFEHSDAFGGLQQTRKLQAFQNNEDDVLDFDDTYDGLADQLQEAGDDFNDDTFGGGAEGPGAKDAAGKDFDFFGRTAQVSDALNEEAVRYGLQQPARQQEQRASRPARSGYEAYQDPEYIPDIQAKSGFWSSRSQPQQQSQQPQHPSQQTASNERISTARSAKPKMMTLEEIEAAMRGQQSPPPPQHAPYPMQGPPPGFAPQQMPQQMHPQMRQQMPSMPQPPPQQAPAPPLQQQPPPPQAQQTNRAPSQPAAQRQGQTPLQILQNPNRPKHSPHSSQNQPLQVGNLPVITHPEQLMQLSEDQRRAYLEEDAKRAKRNHKIFMLSKGNGLMTPQDKNFITRIQLQQLVAATGNSVDSDSEAALVEDFYYQVYSQIRGAPRQHPGQPLGHFAQTYLFQTGGRTNNRRNAVNGDNHMQRMQQQVQRAVEAAKLKPKNKQLIIEGSLGKISFSNAKTPKPLLNIRRDTASDSRPSTGRRQTTTGGSDRKTVLKHIEAVYSDLMAMEDQERKMPPPPQSDSDQETITTHAEWRDELTRLNQQLWTDLKIMDPIVPGSSVTHPFIAFLSFTKGKKAIPRIFRQIDQEQRVTILTMIIVHLDQLDVIRNARPAPGETQPPAHIREEIETFSQAVQPPLMQYISEAPINIMVGLLQLLIDHTNVVNVACTRVGVVIMTLLLSRAELAKDSGEVADADWQQWVSHYNRLFDVLEPILPQTFPGPVNVGDDMYVWQFLAAVGIGASPEQQQRLVIAVKDRVMDTVSQSRALPAEMSRQRLGNVNLFMRAIGLDVDMLG